MIDISSSVGTLIIVCGLPGVGKSTVAGMIAEEIDGEHLRTDEIRKELVDVPQYDAEESQVTYGEMFDRASAKLIEGDNVVLDGTFSDSSKRESAQRLAHLIGANFRIVKVHSAEDVVKERVSKRKDDPSDADFQTYLEKKAAFDDFSKDVIVIDNSGDESETRRVIEKWLKESS